MSTRGSPSRPPLGPRLEAMVAFALPDRPVIDLGADHAYVAIALAQTGHHPRVVAIDASAGALAGARRHAREYGVDGIVELRQGQGLDCMPPGAGGTILIGGIGGQRMLGMLDAAPERLFGVDRLVLQPQTAPERVRRGIAGMGWVILDEVVCPEDGRFYWVIVAERVDSPRLAGNPRFIPPAAYDDLDWRLGANPRRRGDPALSAYLGLEERRLMDCLGGMGPGTAGASTRDPATPARKQELEWALGRIREERRRLEGGLGWIGQPDPHATD